MVSALAPAKWAQGSRFELLDPFRGAAALWVFAFHLSPSGSWPQVLPSVAAFCRMGHFGVSIFFVISGFVVTSAARVSATRGHAASRFLKRRLVRIYPPLWCSMAVVAALPFVIEGLSWAKTGTFLRPSADQSNYGYLRFGALTWIRFASLTQVFASVPGAVNLQAKFTELNSVYWTLAIEVQFYIAMTLAVAWRRYFGAVLFLITALSVVYVVAHGSELSGLFLPYWPMFAAGVGTFLLFERGVRVTALGARVAFWFGAVSLCAVAAALGWFAATGDTPNDFAVTSAVVLLIFGLDGFEERYQYARRFGGPAVKPLVAFASLLGAMSYSIYLLHGRVQFLAAQVSRQIFGDGLLKDLSVVALTVAFCYVFHVVCERPFIRSRSTPGRPAIASDEPSRGSESGAVVAG